MNLKEHSKSLDTSLIEVVVYSDRARAARRGQFTLQSGKHTLEIENLPFRINPESTRVAARGTARARLIGFQLKRTFYTQTPVEKVRELEAQVESTQDEMTNLDAQISLVSQVRAKVDSLGTHTKVFAKAVASGKMSVETQLAVFDGLRTRIDQLDKEIQELQVCKRNLERRLKQLQNQLDQVRSARPLESYSALVDLEVLKDGEITIELSYVISGASWEPLYDLRLLEEESILEVGYLAQIIQQTGEDWEDVSVSLSTARPALAATLPELDPWYVYPKPPPVVPQGRRVASAPMFFMASKAVLPSSERMMEAVAEEQVEAEIAMARFDQSGAAITYLLEGKASILSDGAPHKVTISRYSLIPKLDYVSTPRLVEAVYRRAILINQSDYTLLPGEVNLFTGEEFIGNTQLELTAPQGEIMLYLGVDDRIKVKRELKRREVDKSLIGGKRRIHFGYEIKLDNLTDRQVMITLHDQIPVGQHEDIKVRLESSEPKPTRQTEMNLLDWEITLPAKEKRSIRYDFLVEYPQEMEVMGV